MYMMDLLPALSTIVPVVWGVCAADSVNAALARFGITGQPSRQGSAKAEQMMPSLAPDICKISE